MSSIPRNGRAIESFGTPSSFDREPRDLLWARCTKALFIGLGVTIIMTALYSALFPSPRQVATALSTLKAVFRIGHPLSFALAVALLYILRQKACRGYIQLIAFIVFALNTAFAAADSGSCHPDAPTYFAFALFLFVPAAFIPWKTHNRAALGTFVILSVVMTQLPAHALLPDVRRFWSARAADPNFGNSLILSAVAITILAGVARAIGKTLHNLNRTTRRMKRPGNYIIEFEIGRRGMGRVPLARHARIRPLSAAKFMAAPDREAASARFEREVRVAVPLTHPDTIQIHLEARREVVETPPARQRRGSQLSLSPGWFMA